MNRYFAPAALAACLVLAAAPAAADRTFTLMEETASGQFDQVIQTLANEPADKLQVTEQHLLCHAYAMSKRYDRLFECLERFERKLAAAGDRETLLFALDDATPTVGLMRSQAYIELGRYEDALKEANGVVDWLRKSGEAEPAVAIDAYAALALAEVFAGHRERALPLIPEIEQAGRGLLGDSHKNQRALALGRVHMALGDYAKVVAALDGDVLNGLDAFLDNLFSGAYLRGRDNWLWQELPRLYMLNRARMGMGDFDKARAGYDRLLAIEPVRNNGEIYWMANFDRGQIAERAGDKAGAAGYYARAIDALEIQRLSINTEANKIGFIGDKQSVYARIIRVLIELNRPDEAFEYLERSRARALVDLLAQKQDWRPKRAGAEVARLLQQQKAEDEQRLTQGAAGPSDALWRSGGTDSVRELRRLDPAIAALVSVTTLPIQSIRAALRPEDVLVEYFLDGDHLAIFALSRQGLKVTQVPAAGLRDQVAGLRRAIEARATEAVPLAGRLYDRLIRPIDLGADGNHLLIVPHGPLHYLPFAALHDGQRYLVERRVVSQLSSASVLEFMEKREATRTAAQALVMGNPDLGSRRLNLPHAEQEAAEVAGLLAGSELLLKKAATESAFRRFAGQRGVIHLASHGEFSADEPLRSGLLMAAGDGQDGRLTVNEIYGLDLDARLVTLSACETGLGKVASGDDVIGLIRGFIYAGAGSVLASLWKVDDIATADLMRRFYAERAAAGNAEALRAAQAAMIGKGAHPFYWAAFYLTGR